MHDRNSNDANGHLVGPHLHELKSYAFEGLTIYMQCVQLHVTLLKGLVTLKLPSLKTIIILISMYK